MGCHYSSRIAWWLLGAQEKLLGQNRHGPSHTRLRRSRCPRVGVPCSTQTAVPMRPNHPSLLCAPNGLFCAAVQAVGRAREAPAVAAEGLSPWTCDAERRRLTLTIPRGPCTCPWCLRGPHDLGLLSQSCSPGSQATVVTKGQRMSTYFSPPPLHYIGTVVYAVRKFYFPASHADGGGQGERRKWRSLNTASGKLFKGSNSFSRGLLLFLPSSSFLPGT